MKVVASTSDGIAIVSPTSQFEFLLENNGEYLLPLSINVMQEGRFYIHQLGSLFRPGLSQLFYKWGHHR